MAKKKVVKRKKAAVRVRRERGIEFHSWTFFLFLLFVLVTVLILVIQQVGMRFF
jgi:hypothetical protein